MKKTILIVMLLLGLRGMAQPVTYILPYNTQSRILKLQTLYHVAASPIDSIVVIGPNRWFGRVAISDYGFLTSSYVGFDIRYKPITYTPAWVDITGKPNFFSGDYGDLTNKPDLSVYYLKTNPDGYLKTETDPLFDTKLATKTTSNLVEGSNKYYTDNRVQTFGDGRYQPILGYTPYNSTNPSGFITVSALSPYQLTSGLGTLAFSSASLFSGSYLDLTNKPTLFNGDYNTLSNKPTIPTNNNQLSNGAGYLTGITSTMIGTALGYVPYNATTNPSGFLTGITSVQITTALGYNPVNPNGTNLQYIAGDGGKVTFPAFPVITSDYDVTRTINSSTYTISTTRKAIVRYNIKISCTSTISNPASGRVLFQYSINGGSTWIDGGEVVNENSVTLALVLNSINVQSGFLVWSVPVNALCRLVPTSTGTTTITWLRGQETY